MPVEMWNFHSWPLDVSSIGQSRFVCQVWCSSIQGIYSQLTGGSISQSKIICQVWCTGIQGIYSQLTGRSISQSMFICQVWCSSIQGIYSQLTGGSFGQSRFICHVWCSSIQGIYSQFTLGVIMPKYVHLPTVCILVFKASILDSLGVSIGQSRFMCQVWCSSIQGIYSLFTWGGPSAKVCSSAKCFVLVFKASILDSPLAKVGGVWSIWGSKVCSSAKFLCTVYWRHLCSINWRSISQCRFVCQNWCSSIQGIYSWFPGGSIGQSRFICQNWCSSIQGIYSQFTGGIHWTK